MERITRVRRHVTASPAMIYRALLDPRAVARWMVPDGMTSRVHAFDAREGGAFRISLTYDTPSERARRPRIRTPITGGS